MPTPQQLNYRQMTDSVLARFPLYDRILANLVVNDNLREIMARRTWSGLVKYAVLAVPDTYTTGTVAVTRDSHVVTGTSTAWPYNDVVDTTLDSQTEDTGIIDFTPGSMTGIIAGRWLTIDGGNTNEEAVFVIAIDAAAGTFRARSTKVHAASVTIQCGSYAGRQFRVNSNTPFLTATGFTSATRMLTDMPWAYSTLTGQSYEITMVFVSLGQDVKELLTMVNPQMQFQFQINGQKAMLDAQDPRRNVASMSWILAYHSVDPAGSPLYEIYPRPTSVGAFPYFYMQAWPPLVEDNDILPNGIRSDILVKMGMMEAARWPGHKKLDGGIYYDPGLGVKLSEEIEREIERMKLEDDSTAIMQMIYQYKSWRLGPGTNQEWYNTDNLSYSV